MDNKQYIQDMDGGRLYRTSNGYLLELKNKSFGGSSITEIKKQFAEHNNPKSTKKRKSSRKPKAELPTQSSPDDTSNWDNKTYTVPE